MIFCENLEAFSKRDSYVRNSVIARFFFFGLFALAIGGSLLASPVGNPQEGAVSQPIQSWEFDFSTSLSPGAFASVTYEDDFKEFCPCGQVWSSLDHGNDRVTVGVEGCGGLPPDATAVLATVSVHDSNGVIVAVYQVKAGGGTVIVVLVDE